MFKKFEEVYCFRGEIWVNLFGIMVELLFVLYSGWKLLWIMNDYRFICLLIRLNSILILVKKKKEWLVLWSVVLYRIIRVFV